MASGLTPIYFIPYPLSTDPVDVHGDIQDLALQLEDVLFLKPDKNLPNVFTQQNLFNVNSATDAVRINQGGAGNAFVVEDSANPDATPFVIDATGRVGVGKTTPTVLFDVAGVGAFSGALTASTFNALTLTSNATGYTITGGTTPVGVSFAGGTAYTLSGTNGQTYTFPSATQTLAGLSLAQTWTAAQTFRVANAIRSEVAATQDAIVLAGRAGGTGSFAVTLTPTTLAANRTATLQDVSGTIYISTGTDVTLADGGTNASLTAVNGGIVYSTASAMAISAAGSTGQLLQSGGAGVPTWSTATFPSTATTTGTILRANGTNWVASTSTFADTYGINTILFASAANTVTGLATANNQVLVTGATGIPAFSGTLPSGVTASSLTSFGTSPTLTTPTIDTINASAAGIGALLWNTVITTGSISMGGALTTGGVNIATGAAFNGTVAIATGAGTVNKTINIGTLSTGGTTAVTIGSASGATSTVTLNGAVSTSGNLTVGGNLTVNGTTTTINSTVVNVDDIIIELGAVATPTDITAEGGGISLLGGTNKTITWSTTGNNWTSSENWNIASSKVYKINNAEVLSATRVLGITPTTNATGFTLSGGTTAVAVTFAGGAAYTISGTNGQTYTMPSAGGTLIANPMTTLGDMISGGASGAPTRLANAGTTNGIYLLQQTVAGNVAGAPSWLVSTGTGNNVLATSPSIAGGTHTALTSLGIRDTSAAFDVTLAATSSTALTAGRTLTLDLINAARTIKLNGNIDLGGNLTTASSLTTSGAFALTLTSTNTTNATIPAGTVTLVDLSTSQALTNKTISGLTVTTTTGTLTMPAATVTHAGAFATTITATAITNATLPAGTTTLAANVTTTIGDLIYASATGTPGTLTRLAGNTTTARRFLRQTGDGTNSAAPAWDALVDGDIPTALTGKSYNGLTLTSTTGTFTLAALKTLTVNNTMTLSSAADGNNLNIGTGGTLGSAAFTASTAYEPAITTLAISKGGTGTGTAPTQWGVIYAASATAYASTAAGTNTQVLIGNASGAPTWSNISGLSVSSATTATNLSGTTQYSIPYQTASATTGYIAIGTAGQVLAVNGTTNGYSWVSPFTNPMTTLGDIIYGGASGASTRLAGQTANGQYFLTENVTASASVAPTWQASTGTAGSNVVLATSPTITTPKIDSVTTTTGAAATPTLWSDVTTGSIAIGAGITTGTVNIATVGTGANAINIGNTNSTLTVNGNLTVNGTTTTVNSVTITVDDPNIELNSVASPSDANANGGGITLRGTTNKSIVWDTTNTNWTSSEHWNLATGKVFKINNTQVLSSTVVLGITPTVNAIGFALAGGTTSKTLTVSETLTLTSATAGNTLNIGTGGTLGSAAFTASTAYEPAITTLAISKGGTGTGTAPTLNGVIYASATTSYASTAAGTTGQVLVGNTSAAPTWANASGLSVSSATTATNLSGTTQYSIPYQTASATTGYLNIGSANQVLAVNATTNGYTWVSPFTNPMTTLGDTVYGGASGTATRLVGNTTTTRAFLGQTGDGTNSAAPSWTSSTGTGNVVLATNPSLAGATLTATLQSTLTGVTTNGGGQIYLNGATSNRIDFNANGVSAPAFTTRSTGTKIVLYPSLGASAADYAIGIENATLWQSVEQASASHAFKWYGGTTLAATLTGTGALTTTGSVTASSIIRSGGTAAQYLMADGSVTTAVSAAAGSLTGSTLAAGVTASSLTSLGTLTSLIVSGNLTVSGVVTVPTPVNNTDAANKAYVDSVLNAGVPEIVPLDDISGEFNGIQSIFVPKYQGIKQSITNPLRLQLTINGIIQYVDFPDYVWQSPLPREGFQINNDGNIAFSEVVPAGSRFSAMIQPGPNTITKKRQYPFKAVDILLGG
jgi:hypothetical protein